MCVFLYCSGAVECLRKATLGALRFIPAEYGFAATHAGPSPALFFHMLWAWGFPHTPSFVEKYSMSQRCSSFVPKNIKPSFNLYIPDKSNREILLNLPDALDDNPDELIDLTIREVKQSE